MMNFLKTSAVAAVVAIAPMAASAVTIADGGSTVITSSESYTGLVAVDGGAGMWTHKFEADFATVSGADATVDVSVVRGVRDTFNDAAGNSTLSVSWLAVDGMQIFSTDASADIDSLETVLTTTFGEDPDNIRYLKFNWDQSIAGNGFDFSVDVNVDDVAPVPVPAAGLLLLTALGGAAAMRRRAK